MELDLSEKKLTHFILLEAAGRISMFSSHLLRNRLLKHYNGNRGIIVDLSGVEYMDSSGVATLVEGLSWSRKKNKEFVLVGLGLHLYNTLSLTKLAHLFNIKADIVPPEPPRSSSLPGTPVRHAHCPGIIRSLRDLVSAGSL